MAYRGTKCLSGHNRYRKLYELKFYHTTDARDAPNISSYTIKDQDKASIKKYIIQEHIERQTDRWIDKHLSMHTQRERESANINWTVHVKQGGACL